MAISNPTINIIVSFDPLAMMKLQETGSLKEFDSYVQEKKRKTGKEFTHTFSTKSNLIGLTHNYMGGEKAAGEISVDLIDPDGTLEEKLVDISFEGNKDPKDNPLLSQIQGILDKLWGSQWEERPPTIDPLTESEANWKMELLRKASTTERSKTIEDLENSIKTMEGQRSKSDWHKRVLLDAREKLKKLLSEPLATDVNTLEATEDDTTSNWDISNEPLTSFEFYQLLYEQYSSGSHRPVYITYGQGQNLSKWAPVQCYGKIQKMEYTFNNEGVRVTKLIFQGKGIYPSLTAVGFKPLSNLAKGIQTFGFSKRLFNEDSFEGDKKLYSNKDQEYVEKVFSSYKFPNISKMLTEATTDFIKKATNESNVLVVLPDLDHLLIEYFLQKAHINTNINIDEYINQMENLQAVGGGQGVSGATINNALQLSITDDLTITSSLIKEFLNRIGLSITYSNPLTNGPQTIIPDQSIQQDIYSQGPSVFSAPAIARFKQVDARATLQCDYISQTFMEKLQNVGDSIAELVEVYSNGKTVTFNSLTSNESSLYVETDFVVLNELNKAGLIETALKPAIIWGDEESIITVVKGRAVQAEEDSEATEEVSAYLKLRGFDSSYMSDMEDKQFPFHLGRLFGGLKNLDDSYGEIKDLLTSEDSRDIFPIDSIPVFKFGVSNPNILKLDIDIDQRYIALLNTAEPSKVTSQQTTNSIVPLGFMDQFKTMYQGFKGLRLSEKGKVPPAFKTLVSKYIRSGWMGGLSEKEYFVISNFEEWDNIRQDLHEDRPLLENENKFIPLEGRRAIETIAATGEEYIYKTLLLQFLTTHAQNPNL